jgi:hypothetical protein
MKQRSVSILMHVNAAVGVEALERLRAALGEHPGVFDARVVERQPNLLFVDYDPGAVRPHQIADAARAHEAGVRLIGM